MAKGRATDFESLVEELLRTRGQEPGRASSINAEQLLLASVLEGLASSRKQEALVTAPRTDAYGNRTSYDPLKGWTTDATPQTKSLLEADLREQLLGLTQDAPRNRAALEREAGRSVNANDAFGRAFSEYNNRPKLTEDDYIGRAGRDLALDEQEGLDKYSEVLGRQALRTGGDPAAFARAFTQAQESLGGNRTRARQLGLQEFATYEGAKNNQSQNELQLLAGLAGQDGRTQVPQTTLPQQLNNSSTQALTALIQSLMAGDNSRSSAAGQLAQLLKTR